MSSELYEVLSLAARYLFALLGVIIVLRAFLWLLSERMETRRRLRHLPDAGSIGELLVLQGGPGLEEGAAIPVPWEGFLGSVRSSDITVPCEGIRPRHLFFSYQVGQGLLIRPLSGCEATVDSVVLDCRSDVKAHPMVHGSFLQVGSALLRLRVFAGLESNAGFRDTPEGFSPEAGMPPAAGGYPAAALNPSLPVGGGAVPPSAGYPMAPQGYDPAGAFVPEQAGFAPAEGSFAPAEGGFAPGDSGLAPTEAGFAPAEGSFAPAEGGFVPPESGEGDMNPENGRAATDGSASREENRSAGPRRRRSARWEADWSE